MSSVEFTDFCNKNEIVESKFVDFVGHKNTYTVYGSLFNTDKGLVFQLSKHVEINKDKKSPKRASQEIFSHKFVDDTIYSSFDTINYKEYCDRWGTNFNNLKITINN